MVLIEKIDPEELMQLREGLRECALEPELDINAVTLALTEVQYALNNADYEIHDEEHCAVCGEGDGEYDDVVANCVDAAGMPQLAHYDCAQTEGWRLS